MASKMNPGEQASFVLETGLTVNESSWIAARASSSEILPYQKSWYVVRDGIPLIAHTSPIYISVDGKTQKSSKDAAFFIDWIDESLDWIKNEAIFHSSEQQREMEDLFRRAREVFEEQLEE